MTQVLDDDLGLDLDSVLEPFRPTWDQIRTRINQVGMESGEWAGLPTLCDTVPLVMEPRHPFSRLNGACFERSPEEQSDDSTGPREIEVVNSWWCAKWCANVVVYRIIATGKTFCSWYQENGYPHRFRAMMDTFDPAQYMDLKAEIKAVETLRSHISGRAMHFYLMTGMFMETSKRSGVTYIFRKLAPTIALTPRPKGMMRILECLCLHPIGYYDGTPMGAMVPTDDVIAHLLMMRGDEHLFWRKANHHQPHEFAARI